MNYYLVAAGLLMCASCADNDTDLSPVPGSSKTDVIGFNFSVPNLTRSNLVGKDAADKLSNEFVVYGTKHSAAENGTSTNDAVVFKNYKVEYSENTANTTESNTNNWEYNGKTPYSSSVVSPALGENKTQTVKYWDYSAGSGYTFTAFAGKGFLNTISGETYTEKTDGAKIEKIESCTETGADVYDKGYKVTVPANTSLDDLYFSNRVEVAKTNYGSPVVLTFYNFGSRVRVGFYETVPGYSVKIDKFYYDNDATAAVTTYSAMNKSNEDSDKKFYAALWNVNKEGSKTGEETTGKNTLTVTYVKEGNTANQPTVTNTGATYTPTLELGIGIMSANSLGTSSSNPTWDNSGNYTTVFPNEACNNPMLLRCDYTLTADDGSGETISIKNARVVVPAAYCQWKPNYAYTYLFKISDKTNGTTGKNPSNPDNPGGSGSGSGSESDDPEGLHPITFDAVVVDNTTGIQETISTLSTNTITTYAQNTTSASTTSDEYKAGEAIYVVTSSTNSTTTENTNNGGANPHGVTAPTKIGTDSGDAQVYTLSKAATESEVYAQLTGSKLGITMTALSGNDVASLVSTVPASDGTNITFANNSVVKFTPASITDDNPVYYAYVYCTTKYVAPTYTACASDSYNSTTVYYAKSGTSDNETYYTASGVDETYFGNHKSDLYTKKDGTTGVYDIKVIKVVK